MTTENSKNRKKSLLASQCIVCINDLEMEITREKCTMQGQVAVLPSSCRSGVTFHSFSEKEGVKITQFIIPDHVPTRGDFQPPRAAAAPPPPSRDAAAPFPPGPSTKSG